MRSTCKVQRAPYDMEHALGTATMQRAPLQHAPCNIHPENSATPTIHHATHATQDATRNAARHLPSPHSAHLIHPRDCGDGAKTRRRVVTNTHENNRQACPALSESTRCHAAPCKPVATSCADSDESCLQRAANGDCRTNAPFMSAHCAYSCKKCPGALVMLGLRMLAYYPPLHLPPRFHATGPALSCSRVFRCGGFQAATTAMPIARRGPTTATAARTKPSCR